MYLLGRKFLTLLNISIVPPQISLAIDSFDRPKFAGDHVQLTCVAHGDLPLSPIQWTFQGIDTINNQRGIEISRLGPKSSILTIESVDFLHSGVYSCGVSNRAGNVSKSVELVVNGKQARFSSALA